MNDRPEPRQAFDTPAGLCATCRHARTIVTDRGSRFVRCERAAVDPRFVRYPRLPMRECVGYEPESDAGSRHADGRSSK